MPYRQTNYKVLNSPDLQYICHRPGREECEEHHLLYTFYSFSLDLHVKPFVLSFFLSHFLYISLFFFISLLSFFHPKCLCFSPPSCCSLREPAGKLASGHKLEGCNHMLDIFMEDVHVHVRVCLCVCVRAREKKAQGGV